MLDYLSKGGPLVWPILFVSIWAFALIIERLVFFYRAKKTYRKQGEHWFNLLEKQGLSQTYLELQNNSGLVADVLAEAWNPAHQAETAEKGVEEILSQYFPKLDKSMGTIATLGSLEPMIGLLGTITGMISSFSALHNTGGGDLGEISGGLAVAMINTQLGLATALPILLCHNYLRNRHREVLAVIQHLSAKALKIGQRHGATSSI